MKVKARRDSGGGRILPSNNIGVGVVYRSNLHKIWLVPDLLEPNSRISWGSVCSAYFDLKFSYHLMFKFWSLFIVNTKFSGICVSFAQCSVLSGPMIFSQKQKSSHILIETFSYDLRQVGTGIDMVVNPNNLSCCICSCICIYSKIRLRISFGFIMWKLARHLITVHKFKHHLS